MKTKPNADEPGNFVIIKDHRTGVLYLDNANGMVRNFEEEIREFKTKTAAKKAFPNCKDVTRQ